MTSPPPVKLTRVAIVEDTADICEGLEHVIGNAPDFMVACTCRNVETAMRKIPLCAPDVVVMDIQLPDGDGISCIAKLKQMMPATQFMIFTVHDDTELIFKALQVGASGYLLKRTPPDMLLTALREVKNGGAPMTGEVARKVIESFRKKPAPSSATPEELTRREEEVMELLAEGYPAKEIAQRLQISADTVNAHLKHIYQKLHVHSRVEAVIKYLK
ncbi:MAG TPA: response regulator transcription factor [Opitutaceae bacterium]|nr:response regulator transcription factor [Opitutaceae bacterium]